MRCCLLLDEISKLPILSTNAIGNFIDVLSNFQSWTGEAFY